MARLITAKAQWWNIVTDKSRVRAISRSKIAPEVKAIPI
jgi:hypothetical protein